METFNKDRYIKPVENTVLSHLEYTEHPVSRFENTIAVKQFTTNIVLSIPAGTGITFSEMLSDNLRSRYIYSAKILKLSTYKLIDSNKSGYLYQKIVEKRQ